MEVLADYKAPEHQVTDVKMHFTLEPEATVVASDIEVSCEQDSSSTLKLDGDGLQLLSVAIDGRELGNNEYRASEDELEIFDMPKSCRVQVKTQINPEAESSLMGLYRSGGAYCTQCEPEGFRKITYFLDRPDVRAPFEVTINADAQVNPVLLTNGNLVSSIDLEDGRKEVTYVDHVPKASYLFALVAGKFDKLADTFVTRSGKEVELAIYTNSGEVEHLTWAMDVLKRAMRWDEETYDQEYQFEVFNIAGVERFNFGAMENPTLNVFNSSVLRATPDIATDAVYRRIETVVSHEFFHMVTGNRIGIANWFQLSLKEGFTVMRDTHFSADQNGHSVKYVEEAQNMREGQYPEDRGPNAHPIQLASYESTENNYTPTIYEKGAQVVRMLRTKLGWDGFKRAALRFFDENDGKAATVEDFFSAVEATNEVDLSHFQLWYRQSGHPRVTVKEIQRELDAEGNAIIDFEISQRTPPTLDQADKHPLLIPFAVGAVDPDADGDNGGDCTLILDGEEKALRGSGTTVLDLTATSHSLQVKGTGKSGQLSVLRDYSAPVSVDVEGGDMWERLHTLSVHDTNGFARHEACQAAFMKAIADGSDIAIANGAEIFGEVLLKAAAAKDASDRQLFVLNLSVPSALVILDEYPGRDLTQINRNRDLFLQLVGVNNQHTLEELVSNNHFEGHDYKPDNESIARRGLFGLAMSVLQAAESPSKCLEEEALLSSLSQVDNLTERLLFLRLIGNSLAISASTKERTFEEFYQAWRHEVLVVDQWYRVQASNDVLGTLDHIRSLADHESFDWGTPNRVRALFGVWAHNARHFHTSDGSGYRYLSEITSKLDSRNPQLAVRLVEPLTYWHRLDDDRAQRLKEVLNKLSESAQSKNLKDMISKSLAFRPAA